MLHLTSGPALVVEIGLALFCVVDALITPEAAVRWVPRWAWALFLLAFPLCGVILWLVAGHPWRRRVRAAAAMVLASPPPAPAGRATDAAVLDLDAVAAPCPDTRLVEELLAVHEEHERTLRAWEADLQRREAVLRTRTGHTPAA